MSSIVIPTQSDLFDAPDEPKQGIDAAPPTIDNPSQGTSIEVISGDEPQPDAKGSAKGKPKQPAGSPRTLDSTQEYLSDFEVAALFGVSRPTVWRWILTNPGFPSPKQISPGTSKWKLSEIRAFQKMLDAGQRFEKDKDGRKVRKRGPRPKNGGSAK